MHPDVHSVTYQEYVRKLEQTNVFLQRVIARQSSIIRFAEEACGELAEYPFDPGVRQMGHSVLSYIAEEPQEVRK